MDDPLAVESEIGHPLRRVTEGVVVGDAEERSVDRLDTGGPGGVQYAVLDVEPVLGGGGAGAAQ